MSSRSRNKLRRLFRRSVDSDETSTPSKRASAPPESLRYEGATQGQSPRAGQSPIHSSDSGANGTQTSNVAASRHSTSAARPSSAIDDGVNAYKKSSNGHVASSSPTSSSAYGHSGNAGRERHSEDVANRNIVNNQEAASGSKPPHDFLRYGLPEDSKQQAVTGGRKGSVSRKAITNGSAASGDAYGTSETHHSPAPNKPLPATPNFSTRDRVAKEPVAEDIATSRHLGKDREYLIKDGAEKPSLEGIVDLRNTEDTSVHEEWAPAVTHEVVDREVHHIRQEEITREIHYHDVYHRVLPIIDIEVLPARHFVPDGKGGLIEISKDEIPGRAGQNQDWVIAEMVSKLTPETHTQLGPRQFTARSFPGAEGDYKEYISEAGIPTTETTWVHPPTVADWGRKIGQTVPFYFGSPDPRDDGLRVYAPRGPITGSSPLHAQQTRALSQAPIEEEMGKLSLQGQGAGASSRGADLAGAAPSSATTRAATGVHDYDEKKRYL